MSETLGTGWVLTHFSPSLSLLTGLVIPVSKLCAKLYAIKSLAMALAIPLSLNIFHRKQQFQ